MVVSGPCRAVAHAELAADARRVFICGATSGGIEFAPTVVAVSPALVALDAHEPCRQPAGRAPDGSIGQSAVRSPPMNMAVHAGSQATDRGMRSAAGNTAGMPRARARSGPGPRVLDRVASVSARPRYSISRIEIGCAPSHRQRRPTSRSRSSQPSSATTEAKWLAASCPTFDAVVHPPYGKKISHSLMPPG